MTEGRSSSVRVGIREQSEDIGLSRAGLRESLALFSAAVCLLSSSISFAATGSQQQELENLRERIAAMQRELDKTSETKSEVADTLRESERAISNSNRKLAELAQQQRAADAKLGKLREQEKQLNVSLAGQQALLGKLLHQQYLSGRQEYLKLLLSGENPSKVSRDLQYYQYVARNRANWLTTMSNDLVALKAVSDSTREQYAEIAAVRKEESAQKTTLERERQSRRLMLAKVSKQLRQQHREIGRLQANESRLAQLVEKLNSMLGQPKSGTLFRNDNLPDNRFDGEPFSHLIGKLTLPVKGEVTNRFNTPRPDSTVMWKGLFLRTSSGQPVKAVAAGRVVYADWLRGFGNLLIIDHGDGYMSLYGNNETLYKQVGDVLHGGDVIAAVGNSGGNEDFGLYFELRHESKPLDPMKWMAKNPSR